MEKGPKRRGLFYCRSSVAIKVLTPASICRRSAQRSRASPRWTPEAACCSSWVCLGHGIPFHLHSEMELSQTQLFGWSSCFSVGFVSRDATHRPPTAINPATRLRIRMSMSISFAPNRDSDDQCKNSLRATAILTAIIVPSIHLTRLKSLRTRPISQLSFWPSKAISFFSSALLA